ncbi:hypothetical protein BJX64DRAFT_231720 [Aspergillus heterothallicus]
MEIGFGVAGVIQAAAGLAITCARYIKEVKDCPKEIHELNREITSFIHVLESVQTQLGGPRGGRLAILGERQKDIKECSAVLVSMDKRLLNDMSPHHTRSSARKLFRYLKWPLKRDEVIEHIKQIDRYKSLFSLALQADNATNIHQIEMKLDLQKLRIAGGAEFNTYYDTSVRGHNVCLDGTRAEVLDLVEDWAESPQGKCIFWLSGGAGTGKSTISRTIVGRLENKKLFGGSFCFRQGVADQDNAKLLFPTLVNQLADRIPGLKLEIQKVIDDDPLISDRALGQQFEKLVVLPFREVNIDQDVTLVVVIDALDECGSDVERSEIKSVLQLLPRVQSLERLHLRFLLTSRGEWHIRQGFRSKVKGNLLQELDLYNVPLSEITRDISIFFDHSFQNMREARGLRPHWPGDRAKKLLLDKTVPLFISAATLCRFIRDAPDPEERLKKLLTDEFSYVSKMAATYLPILNQLLVGQSEDDIQGDVLPYFRNIVGSIILLATPVPMDALSELVGIRVSSIQSRLQLLHSVLNVPEASDKPIVLYHLSFRDFLLETTTKSREESKAFWIDKAGTHQTLTEQCLAIMNRMLSKNICKLPNIGFQKGDISSQIIQKYLPSELQYACRYWTRHLMQCRDPTRALVAAYPFLKAHLLHWIEVMGILGSVGELVEVMSRLQTVALNEDDIKISQFLHDAQRFILKNRQVAELAPLQLYSSGLMFCPTSSIIRRLFESELSAWARLPRVEEYWGAELQTLEDHTDAVLDISVSPDGQKLASASQDGTVKLWHSVTGQLQQTLSEHTVESTTVSFSHDGQQLTSGEGDGAVKLWDTSTGELLRTFEGHTDWVHVVKFSPDSQKLASGSSDGTLRIWDLTVSKPLQTCEGHSGSIYFVEFSPNGQQIVSGSETRMIKLWDAATGELVQILEHHSGYSGLYNSVAFSPDEQQLASGSDDGTITLWFPTRRTLRPTDRKQPMNIKSVAFSPDSQRLASIRKGTVEIWDLTIGSVERTYEDPSGQADSVVFSPNGKQLAFSAGPKIVRVWNFTTSDPVMSLTSISSSISAFVFLPDSQQLATASDDSTLRLWDLTASELHPSSTDDSGQVRSICISPDGQQVACGLSNGDIRTWDTITGDMKSSFRAHHQYAIQSVSFASLNSSSLLLASGSSDPEIKLWDPRTSKKGWASIKVHGAEVMSLRFSPNDRLISGCGDGNIKVWHVVTGRAENTIRAHDGAVTSFTLTPDGRVVSGSSDGTSKVWNLAGTTAEPQTILRPGDIREPIQSICLSPDGQQLACSSSKGPTRLWDISTAQLQQTIDGHSHWSWFESGASVSIFDGQWLCLDRERKLWLPKQYRANHLMVTLLPHHKTPTIILGHPSGKVSFLSTPP